MSLKAPNHSELVAEQWKELARLINKNGSQVTIDGSDLSLAEIAYVARYNGRVKLGQGVNDLLYRSINALNTQIGLGGIIYGVNTGFGSAADNRTTQKEHIQRTLTRELSYGILAPGSRDHRTGYRPNHIKVAGYDISRDNDRQKYHLPWTWVRAAILIRINTLAQGYSAVRPVVVENMRDLLNHDIVPMIPLRGSISASGDLNPLAYIAGTIQGKATIRILTTDQTDVYANDALARSDINPISLQAKEGLAIVNGTAISAAAGFAALYDAHSLVILGQMLSAMSVESLLGTDESFHPFLGDSRPHPGQIECASNMRKFLQGSKFVIPNDGSDKILRQDRYSIRTVPQWIGPALEDIVLAHQQISIECNAATDNPLVDHEGNVIHGGNFQARSVTSAMEKTRQVMQTVGRMLFAQCSEMINPLMSRGLPPDLVLEDPTSSGVFRSTDIHMPALVSELTFLASPVNSVQTAERGNQSLNSLALVSARYTNTSVEVLSELAAAHLLAACQALDCRAFQFDFLESYRSIFFELTTRQIKEHALDMPAESETHVQQLWKEFTKLLDSTVQLDAKPRFDQIAQTLRLMVLDWNFIPMDIDSPRALSDHFHRALQASLLDTWTLQRDAWMAHGDASRYLGLASRHIYHFVRKELKIPFLCTARILTPTMSEALAEDCRAPTVGQYTATIYRAIRDGTLTAVMLNILDEEAIPAE